MMETSVRKLFGRYEIEVCSSPRDIRFWDEVDSVTPGLVQSQKPPSCCATGLAPHLSHVRTHHTEE